MDGALELTTFSFSAEAPSPPERRASPRHLTILRVGTMLVDGRRELCLIRNISAGGMMVHVYSAVEPEQRISIELKSNQPVSGTVSWSRDSNIGIQFDEQIDVEELLASQGVLENGWRARLPRVEVDRLGTVRLGARVYPVNTQDISQGGVKLETDHPIEEGSEVVLTLDKLRPVHGVVRWSRDGLCGISFNQVIPFHELMRWIRGKE